MLLLLAAGAILLSECCSAPDWICATMVLVPLVIMMWGAVTLRVEHKELASQQSEGIRR